MEKQRDKSDTKSFRRLLKILGTAVFLSAICFPSPAQSNTARFVPSEDQNLFTKTDIKFEVFLPSVRPGDVVLQNVADVKNVTMRTMRKNQGYGENGGTGLEVWFSFEKKGTYRLPPLNILVKGRPRNIPFEPVEISDNPETLFPRIVIAFPDGRYFYSDEYTPETDRKSGNEKPFLTWKNGEKLEFSVCLQYTVQLVQFDWELPPDSIFSQTKTYDILEIKYREKHYSHELIPVADFEWTSLAEGEKSFPKIHLTATAYNGYRTEIAMPDFKINFTKNESSSQVQKTADIFDRSFALFDTLDSGAENESSDDDDGVISLEDCELLAALRHKERTEIFSWKKNINERKAFESTLGIKASLGEFFMGIFYFSLLIFLVCVTLFIIFFKKRSVLFTLLTSALMIFALVFLLFVSIQKNRLFGISKGCRITSIPDENAKAESKIGAGNRVQITEEAGEWIYIQLGESGGWCKKSDVVFIN